VGTSHLEASEGLEGVLGRAGLLDLDEVEGDGLGEGAALTDDDGIALIDAERGGGVGSEGDVTLLVTGHLGDEVEVVTADDDGAAHLGGADNALEDAATDGHSRGEGALLVDVGTLDGLLGGLEAEADVLVEAGLLLVTLDLEVDVLVDVDTNLLLVGALVL